MLHWFGEVKARLSHWKLHFGLGRVMGRAARQYLHVHLRGNVSCTLISRSVLEVVANGLMGIGQCHLCFIHFHKAECEQVRQYTILGVHCMQSSSGKPLNAMQSKVCIHCCGCMSVEKILGSFLFYWEQHHRKLLQVVYLHSVC